MTSHCDINKHHYYTYSTVVDSLAGSGLCPVGLLPTVKERVWLPSTRHTTRYVCYVRVEDGRVEIATSSRRWAFTINGEKVLCNHTISSTGFYNLEYRLSQGCNNQLIVRVYKWREIQYPFHSHAL